MAATAYAALVSLQNTLHLILDPPHCFYFEPRQIFSLLVPVDFLVSFMKNFNNCYGAKALYSRIARAAQAAEDALESHFVDKFRSGSILGGHRRVYFLLDLQKAIKDMDFVARKVSNLSVAEGGVRAEQPTFSAATSSASEKNRMVGFEYHLRLLLDLLTGQPSSQLQVIPLVGMGGIGKTTLATNALQHPYIAYYFDICLWATISQEFDLKKILSVLLAQIKQQTSLSNMSTDLNSVDELGLELHKNLYGRRYLIILDDMWSVEAWDGLKLFFPDKCNGSRIVITTRQYDIADHLEDWKFSMRLLDEESSWNLFCQKTFEEQGCPPELQDIGKKIAQNCGGLPLAIVVVGGHLQQSREMEYWENVAKDMSFVLNSGESEECMNILSLSYRYLPAHLKPCFVSLGVFPEDQEIPMSDIYNLWIGEGFLPYIPGLTLEQVAFFSLQALIERNLVSYHEIIGLDRTEIFCKVHDLQRELCLKITKKEGFLSTLDTQRTINRDRRVVMKGKIPEMNHQQQIFDFPRSATVVRSLICEGGELSFDLKLLRVLNKVDKTLGTRINIQQVNLRYLKVDVLCKSFLPKSISSSISLLSNLQTLKISRADGLILAPYEIWEMPQLRHVEVDQLCLPHPLPIDSLDMENDSVLKNLHTLSKVKNFMLSEEVCRRIPNIEELKLSYCGEPSLDYCLHNLVCFQKLETLECYFDGNGKWHDSASSLTFPDSLKRLRLRGGCLDWEELTTKVGFLPHLSKLELYKYSVRGSEWSPVEEGFLKLRELNIRHCELIHWNAEYIHFPMLKVVRLEGLSLLDEIPSGIGEIPTLHLIVVENCSLSSTFSAIQMVVEQKEQGNEDLRLFVYLKGDEETLEDFKQKVEIEDLRKGNICLDVEKVSQDKSLFLLWTCRR